VEKKKEKKRVIGDSFSPEIYLVGGGGHPHCSSDGRRCSRSEGEPRKGHCVVLLDASMEKKRLFLSLNPKWEVGHRRRRRGNRKKNCLLSNTREFRVNIGEEGGSSSRGSSSLPTAGGDPLIHPDRRREKTQDCRLCGR